MLYLRFVPVSDYDLPDYSGAMKVKIITAFADMWYNGLKGRVRIATHIVKIWDKEYYVMRNYIYMLRVIPCEHAEIIEP
jgi:hypothetical protein